MKLDRLKMLTDEELIDRAVDWVCARRPEFDRSCFDGIVVERARDSIDVRMKTAFEFYPLGGHTQGESFRVSVRFLDDRISGAIPEELFVPPDVYWKILSIVGRTGAAEGLSVSVHERPGLPGSGSAFEATITHDSGGAEGYAIDLATGEMTMTWHEHPDHGCEPEIINGDSTDEN